MYRLVNYDKNKKTSLGNSPTEAVVLKDVRHGEFNLVLYFFSSLPFLVFLEETKKTGGGGGVKKASSSKLS